MSDNISSIKCIDSVRLGGSELRGEKVPPCKELSEGTLSKLAYSWSLPSFSSSESLWSLEEKWKKVNIELHCYDIICIYRSWPMFSSFSNFLATL